MSERVRSAPGIFGCCDAAGRLVMLAYQPRARADLIALAVARGEGTRDEIEARVQDLIAAGQLIEVQE